MNEGKTIVFFRIDDVGDIESDEKYLQPLLDLFIDANVPFNLEVIPASLSQRTIQFVNQLKTKSPHLVEIDQHGFSHDIQEFSTSSSFDHQLTLIKRGNKILEEAFGEKPIGFTPPEHVYTETTLRVLDSLKFKIFSKHIKGTRLGNIFYSAGRAMGKKWLMGKKVSYHLKKIPSTNITEISIVIESIWPGGRVKTNDEFKKEFHSIRRRMPVCGVLLHPVHFNSREYLDRMRSNLEYLKESNVQCLGLGKILKKLEN